MISEIEVASWPCGVVRLSGSVALRFKLPPNAAWRSAITPARTAWADGVWKPVAPKVGCGTFVATRSCSCRVDDGEARGADLPGRRRRHLDLAGERPARERG